MEFLPEKAGRKQRAHHGADGQPRLEEMGGDEPGQQISAVRNKNWFLPMDPFP